MVSVCRQASVFQSASDQSNPKEVFGPALQPPPPHTQKENRQSRRGTKRETGRSEHETELPPILMQASAILVIINERYKL